MTLKSASELVKGAVIVDAGNSKEFLTGDWRSKRPVVDHDKCINCLTCWIFCPDDSIIVKDGKMEGFRYSHCKGCGICATQCPKDAIQMIPEGN